MTNDEREGRPYGVAPPGFRLPEATRVGAVRLQVSDLERSVAYYRDVLGLRAEAVASGRVALAPAGEGPPLVWLETRPGVAAARRGALGLYHFAILLPDRAALGRFAAHLARLGARFASADHRVSEALYLWDPDGLGIEVYADRARERWEHRGRQLVMTTEPLDLEDLVDAGGHEGWAGMPPGTTMGHVHLHVGSLAEAKAFYHRALGLDVMVWEYPGALFLAAGGYHHHLGTNTWAPGPAARPDEAQLLEWELVVPSPADVRAAAANLRAAGHGAEEVDGGCTAQDPWGTRLRIAAAG